MKNQKLGTLGTKAQLAIALAAIGAADSAIAGTRWIIGGPGIVSCTGQMTCSGSLPGGSQTWNWCCSLGPIERCGSAQWFFANNTFVAGGSCISGK